MKLWLVQEQFHPDDRTVVRAETIEDAFRLIRAYITRIYSAPDDEEVFEAAYLDADGDEGVVHSDNWVKEVKS